MRRRVAVIFAVIIFLFSFVSCKEKEAVKKEEVPADTIQKEVPKETPPPVAEPSREISYEDALYELFEQFDINNENADKLFEQYNAKTLDEAAGKSAFFRIAEGLDEVNYAFADTDNDNELEVLIFYSGMYGGSGLGKEKSTFVLFDYSKEKGFTNLYSQNYPFDPILHSAEEPLRMKGMAVFVDGFVDPETQQKKYMLLTSDERYPVTELSNKTYSLRVDMITNKGLEKLCSRNAYLYYNEESRYEFLGERLGRVEYILKVNDYFNRLTQFSVEMNYFSYDDKLDIVALKENVLAAHRRAQSLIKLGDSPDIWIYKWYADEDETLETIAATTWSDYGNTSTNLMNGGLVASNAMWTFFCANEGIYRMENEDTSERVFIHEVNQPSHLNIVKDKLYFLSNGIIYCMKFDGTEVSQISPPSEYCSQFQFYGDSIYMYGGGARGIKRTDVDGGNLRYIYKDERSRQYNVNIERGQGIEYLYFVEHPDEYFSLNKREQNFEAEGYYGCVNGNTGVAVSGAYMRGMSMMQDGFIYWNRTGNGFGYTSPVIVKANPSEGGEMQVVLVAPDPEERYVYAMVKDKIVYSKSDGIFIANLDRSNTKKVSDKQADYLYVDEYNDVFYFVCKNQLFMQYTFSSSNPVHLCDINAPDWRNWNLGGI